MDAKATPPSCASVRVPSAWREAIELNAEPPLAGSPRGEDARVPLEEYRRKRDPSRTPEPFARRGKEHAAPVFVVQRHAARRLHYDLRLERDGALASWAVPKGVSRARGQRHLAVHVEDHPLEYADFEGEIPAGQYGAGTVEIWDRGTYELLEEKRNGGLTVELHGARLRGVWTLVPAALDGDPRNWLLIRKDSERDAAPEYRADAGHLRRASAGGRGLGLRAEVGRLPRARHRAGR